MDRKLNCVCGEKLSTDEFMCSSCILIYIEEPAGPSTIQPSIWQQPSQDSTQGALFENNPSQYAGSEACPGYLVEPQQWTPNQIFPQNPLASAQPPWIYSNSPTTHHATHNLMPSVYPAISESESTASHDPHYRAQQQYGPNLQTSTPHEHPPNRPSEVYFHQETRNIESQGSHYSGQNLNTPAIYRSMVCNNPPDEQMRVNQQMKYDPRAMNSSNGSLTKMQYKHGSNFGGLNDCSFDHVPEIATNESLGLTPDQKMMSLGQNFTDQQDLLVPPTNQLQDTILGASTSSDNLPPMVLLEADAENSLKCPLCEKYYVSTTLFGVHRGHMIKKHPNYKICGVCNCYTYFKKGTSGDKARNAHDNKDAHSRHEVKCRYRSCDFGPASIQEFRKHECKVKLDW